MELVWIAFVVFGIVLVAVNLILLARSPGVLGVVGVLCGAFPIVVGLWNLGVFG